MKKLLFPTCISLLTVNSALANIQFGKAQSENLKRLVQVSSTEKVLSVEFMSDSNFNEIYQRLGWQKKYRVRIEYKPLRSQQYSSYDKFDPNVHNPKKLTDIKVRECSINVNEDDGYIELGKECDFGSDSIFRIEDINKSDERVTEIFGVQVSEKTIKEAYEVSNEMRKIINYDIQDEIGENVPKSWAMTPISNASNLDNIRPLDLYFDNPVNLEGEIDHAFTMNSEDVSLKMVMNFFKDIAPKGLGSEEDRIEFFLESTSEGDWYNLTLKSDHRSSHFDSYHRQLMIVNYVDNGVLKRKVIFSKSK